MRITGLGHAGLYVETSMGSLLCDPWSTPAFFDSWHPYYDNRSLDWARFRDADFLYISHRHQDHFDPSLLRHVLGDRQPLVLLPDYPTRDLEQDLLDFGFRHLQKLPAGDVVNINGLSVMITPMRSPSDGPLGDSSLSLSDGQDSLLNQNDAHLLDLETINAFGPYVAHFMQHSGAIWWPMAYDLPPKARRHFAALKRSSQQQRALYYAEKILSAAIFPFAGPPAFFNDELFRFNGHGQNDDSIFTTQTEFLRLLRDSGNSTPAYLFAPGTVVDLHQGNIEVSQTLYSNETITKMDTDMWSYLEREKQRRRTRPTPSAPINMPADTQGAAATFRNSQELLERLKGLFEPLMQRAPTISEALKGGVTLCIDGDNVHLDFTSGRVSLRADVSTTYWFRIPGQLIRATLDACEPDWVNSIFLSMRFAAGRIGKFNEHLYAFFTSLSASRMDYVEDWFSRRQNVHEMMSLEGRQVQRFCPHLGADLSVSGSVDGKFLVCNVHGWRFDLDTGRCTTSKAHALKVEHDGSTIDLPSSQKDQPGGSTNHD